MKNLKSFSKNLLGTLGMLLITPSQALANTGEFIGMTDTVFGYVALAIFVLGYLFVVTEEKTHLAKSKPMMVAAGLIWIVVGLAYAYEGQQAIASAAFQRVVLEYAELFLFLLSAMTFIHMMEERHVFLALRSWLIARDFSLRRVFWATGGLTFLLSPIADNLSTALLMGAVVMAVGGRTNKFVVLGSINVVIAANAGGVFSPFGDITSLMVWQQHKLQFFDFFYLIPPALVSWLVPAALMHLKIPDGPPQAPHEQQRMKRGGMMVILMFISTAALSVFIHSYLELAPVLGMMTGLGVLKIYGYLLSRRDPLAHEHELRGHHLETAGSTQHLKGDHGQVVMRFDNFRVVERASWDTLMFFYGVVLSVGGLATLGYLQLASSTFYGGLGPLATNSLVGLFSALIDNIPMMYAILSMNYPLSTDQWLLVTLTIGIGGSILAIGSAAGVALMGQAAGIYTFKSHLRWSWAILLGYGLSIATHLALVATIGE